MRRHLATPISRRLEHVSARAAVRATRERISGEMHNSMEHPHLARFRRLERLSRVLDAAFRIPGTRFRFGYDAIASIVPVLGDLAGVLPAAWIMYESHRMGLPPGKLARQGANVAIDAVFGSVPILGTLFDAGYRANLKNVEILREHLGPDAFAVPDSGRVNSRRAAFGRR